jgi:hypothetical protein
MSIYAKRAAAFINNGGKAPSPKVSDGTYKCKLFAIEYKESRSGNMMYVTEWKILDKGAFKGKLLKTVFVEKLDFAMDRFFALLVVLGADLSEVTDADGILDVCEALETESPVTSITVQTVEGKQYPQLTFDALDNVAVTKSDSVAEVNTAPRKKVVAKVIEDEEEEIEEPVQVATTKKKKPAPILDEEDEDEGEPIIIKKKPNTPVSKKGVVEFEEDEDEDLEEMPF